MTPHPIKTSRQQQRTVDDAVHAYVAWREGCIGVWEAYRRWASAPAADTSRAFGAYESALDREESAAKAYAELIGHVGDLVDTGLLQPLPRPPQSLRA